jgi:hypothetical protein
MENLKIHIDLVPKTCWFSNVRSQVSSSDWDWLRKQAYKAANHKCEVCDAKGRLEAHEIWHYDDKNLIQKLHAITAVCKSCHELYHLGFASINGKLPQALRRLAKVNSWSMETTKEYVDIVFEIWMARSKKNWTLDLKLLDDCNIQYKLIDKEQRLNFAIENLK